MRRGDDQHGLAIQMWCQILFEIFFGAIVERIGRLIQQQHRRIEQQSARNRDGLPLAAGQAIAALADRHVKPLRVAIDELGSAGNFGRAQYRLVIDVRRCQYDIILDTAKEQHWILRYVADVASQVGRVELLLVTPSIQIEPELG